MNPAPAIRVVDGSATSAASSPVATVRRAFEPLVRDGAVPPSPRGAEASGPSPAGPRPAAPAFPAALRDVEGMRARLDGMLAEARRGRTFSPQELLCLQADAHRFAQTVEFSARAVEHGVQGLRQAVNSQV